MFYFSLLSGDSACCLAFWAFHLWVLGISQFPQILALFWDTKKSLGNNLVFYDILGGAAECCSGANYPTAECIYFAQCHIILWVFSGMSASRTQNYSYSRLNAKHTIKDGKSLRWHLPRPGYFLLKCPNLKWAKELCSSLLGKPPGRSACIRLFPHPAVHIHWRLDSWPQHDMALSEGNSTTLSIRFPNLRNPCSPRPNTSILSILSTVWLFGWVKTVTMNAFWSEVIWYGYWSKVNIRY